MITEAAARNKVHKLLPPRTELDRQSTTGVNEGGTWDFMYRGYGDTLWIEWKRTTVKGAPSKPPALTALQIRWGLRAYIEGQHAAVIEASPTGYRIFRGRSWHPDNWKPGTPPNTAAQTAEWIVATMRMVRTRYVLNDAVIRWAAKQPCKRSNCGTVCKCPPCHARDLLQHEDE